VSDAGRNYDHVSRRDLDRLPLRAAEGDARGTADHAKHLVGVGVVVVEGEDAVDPGATPAVSGEQFLAARGVEVGPVEHLLVYEHRQRRVVGDAAIVLEPVLPWLLRSLSHMFLPVVDTKNPSSHCSLAQYASISRTTSGMSGVMMSPLRKRLLCLEE
jgi:hypothetical protein